jgi:hypothetical protein
LADPLADLHTLYNNKPTARIVACDAQTTSPQHLTLHFTAQWHMHDLLNSTGQLPQFTLQHACPREATDPIGCHCSML